MHDPPTLEALRRELDELRVLVHGVFGTPGQAEADSPRPDLPTLAYCCPRPHVLRWRSSKTIRPALWALAHYLIGRCTDPDTFTLDMRRLEDDLAPEEESNFRRWQQRIYDLNPEMTDLRFPFTFYTRSEIAPDRSKTVVIYATR